MTTIAACSSDAPNLVTPADSGVDASLAPGTGNPDAGGDSSAAPDAAPAGPTIGLAAAADQLADAECALVQRCFPSYLSLFVSSVAECKSGLSVEARARYAPGAVFDKAAFDASTSCFQTLPCDELYGHEIETLCSQPKPSNAAPLGAECNKPNDCASAFCDGKTDAACGHCAASVVGVADHRVAQPDDEPERSRASAAPADAASDAVTLRRSPADALPAAA